MDIKALNTYETKFGSSISNFTLYESTLKKHPEFIPITKRIQECDQKLDTLFLSSQATEKEDLKVLQNNLEELTNSIKNSLKSLKNLILGQEYDKSERQTRPLLRNNYYEAVRAEREYEEGLKTKIREQAQKIEPLADKILKL